MISYKEFIKRMEDRGYNHKGITTIDISDSNIRIFPVKKKTVGKFLELRCPNNTIISICGKNHGCNNSYYCKVKCFNTNDKEPFRDLHYSTPLTPTYHVVIEMIVTKIMQKPPDQNNPEIQEWAKYVNPMLKLIDSEDPCEYPIWSGAYKIFPDSFLDNSFNLYSNEKMVFYVINSDIDIVKTKFELKADILELKS